jgi:aspartate/methionine/tyrosine aminotransferase
MTLSRIEPFALERYFARHEFAVRHQLSASDVEPLTMAEVLAMADGDGRRRWEELSLAYTEAAGLPALREEIARTYDGLGPENVQVLSGAEEGILLAALATLQPGQHAVIVTPAYQSLFAIPRAIGASVTLVPLRHDTGWLLDPGDVERALTRHTRLVVINFPHNPTGAHIRRDVLEHLTRVTEAAGAILLSDEVYRGLEYESSARLPCAADLSDRAVSLGVMSKSFALPGVRIGWLASRDTAWLARVAALRDYSTICSSAPSEILALVALRAREQVLERSRTIVATNLAHANATFAQWTQLLEWVPPKAGSVAFPKLVTGDATRVSERLIERHSVLLMPGAVFDADATSHFRLGLGRRDFPVALERLGSVLRESA